MSRKIATHDQIFDWQKLKNAISIEFQNAETPLRFLFVYICLGLVIVLVWLLSTVYQHFYHKNKNVIIVSVFLFYLETIFNDAILC